MLEKWQRRLRETAFIIRGRSKLQREAERRIAELDALITQAECLIEDCTEARRVEVLRLNGLRNGFEAVNGARGKR